MPQALFSLPLSLILFGTTQFLKSTDILPATPASIAIGLAIVGIIVIVLDDISKQSVTSGPILIYAGAVVYLYMQYQAGFSSLVALGTMVLGCMFLLSRSSIVSHRRSKQVKTDDSK